MTFKKCSIRGKLYGETSDGDRGVIDNDFIWSDRTLIDDLARNDDETMDHFFSLLVVCHTVVSEESNGKILYQAQSPDEYALVIAARAFDFVFLVSPLKIERNLMVSSLRAEHRTQSQFVAERRRKRTIC